MFIISHLDSIQYIGIFLIEFGIFLFIIIPTLVAAIKGAPWVPTPMARAKHMLEVAKIKPGEKVYDLGCGDGRLVYLAAKNYQADAIGFELSPIVYLIAKLRQLLWQSKAKILFKDFRKVNISDANVILCYLLPDTLKVFREKFERELKKGTRIISYAFRIGDWEPIMKLEKVPEKNLGTVWVYEMR